MIWELQGLFQLCSTQLWSSTKLHVWGEPLWSIPTKDLKQGFLTKAMLSHFSLHTGGKLHGGRFLTKETCNLKGLWLVFFGIVFQCSCESACGGFLSLGSWRLKYWGRQKTPIPKDPFIWLTIFLAFFFFFFCLNVV